MNRFTKTSKVLGQEGIDDLCERIVGETSYSDGIVLLFKGLSPITQEIQSIVWSENNGKNLFRYSHLDKSFKSHKIVAIEALKISSTVDSIEKFNTIKNRIVGKEYQDGFKVIQRNFVTSNRSDGYELFYLIWSENHSHENQTEMLFFGCNFKISTRKLSAKEEVFEDLHIKQLKPQKRKIIDYIPVRN